MAANKKELLLKKKELLLKRKALLDNSTSKPVEDNEPIMGPVKSAALGAGQALTLDHMDELVAGAKTLFDSDADYDKELETVREEFAKLKGESPSAFTLGEVATYGVPAAGAIKALRASPKLWSALKKGGEAAGFVAEPMSAMAMKLGKYLMGKGSKTLKDKIKSKVPGMGKKTKNRYAGSTK